MRGVKALTRSNPGYVKGKSRSTLSPLKSYHSKIPKDSQCVLLRSSSRNCLQLSHHLASPVPFYIDSPSKNSIVDLSSDNRAENFINGPPSQVKLSDSDENSLRYKNSESDKIERRGSEANANSIDNEECDGNIGDLEET
jgi:hypothetical protein